MGSVELVLDWLDGKRDDAGVYELSLNGGTDWEAVDMARVGLSNRYRGLLESIEPSTNATLQEYALANADTSGADFNTNSSQKRAALFTVTTKEKVKELTVYIGQNGSPSGSLTAQIVRDDSGAPSSNSADILYESSMAISGLSLPLVLTLGRTLAAGDYWIVIKTDEAYASSYVSFTTSLYWAAKAVGPNSGQSGSLDGAWSVDTDVSLCYKTSGFDYDLRLRATASANGKAIEAFAVFFAESQGQVVSGDDAIQNIEVDGDADTTEFVVTQFLPDPRKLKIYDTYSHLVYRYPTFELDGHTVRFLAGSFLIPGEKFQLVFDQSEGGGFDNSDRNAALMAANGLGSSDPDIDKSAAGVGIKMRSPNGTLWQLKVLNDGSVLTEEV
jgi:hypothetical protein